MNKMKQKFCRQRNETTFKWQNISVYIHYMDTKEKNIYIYIYKYKYIYRVMIIHICVCTCIIVFVLNVLQIGLVKREKKK